LRLLDGEELLDLILEHYENLDPQHQAVIPLERIYVPVRVKTSEDDE
jgi:restriction system protein